MTNNDIARVVAEADIRNLTARFADAATRGDLDAFRSLWTQDAVFRIGDQVHAKGVDDVVTAFGQLRNDRDFFVQFAVQGPIVIDGDGADTSTICHEEARGPGENYHRNHCVSTDRLTRGADGKWLFASRDYQYLWLDTSPFEGQSFTLPS